MTGPAHTDMQLAGRNNVPRQVCHVYRPARRADVATLIEHGIQSDWIARGLGRSYGDSMLNEGRGVIDMTPLDRLLAFDADTGTLECEAGVSLKRIIDTFLPRGWFPAVTPGTKHVTVGGAIACDVHGKNHHRDGSFANCVDQVTLLTAAGETLACSRDENAEVFFATLGGMGLTGVLLTVRLRLKRVASAYLNVRFEQAGNLDDLLAAFADDAQHSYSVAWIDGLARGAKLGRGVLMRGEHAEADDLPAVRRERPFDVPVRFKPSVPCDLPGFVLNRYTVAAFNARYYRKHRSGERLLDYDAYFYPLDGVGNWHRLYGRRGFYQYQFVVPEGDEGGAAVRHVMERLTASRRASFLAVLKRFGPESGGLLSFPVAGYTLAIDLPNRGDEVLALMHELDAYVVERGGRVYLAKDACLKREHFERMYPRLDTFKSICRRLDPQRRLASSQARRLGLVEVGS
ncbi:FAD-binding protein [Phycisphaerales bacterium AB-hyl4]|uniref:FAD-binding protein n=1 Tax=Natronomicrosphaera hydrolytica TaxID=3242702 RepID=A0ABV4U6H7_9BACT